MFESVVVAVTLALPWHLTIPQPDKGKIRRSSLKPEGDLESHGKMRGVQAWKPCPPPPATVPG